MCYTLGIMIRPAKEPSQRRRQPLQIRLTDGERELIERAADRNRAKPSTWARVVLVEAAVEEIGDAEPVPPEMVTPGVYEVPIAPKDIEPPEPPVVELNWAEQLLGTLRSK